jgi:multidrug resistance protein
MDTRAQAFPKSGRIFIFGFLSAIAPLSIDIYLPALPMLRQALAADEAQTLFTLSAFFIGFGGGQLLFGPLSDRFGRKPILIVGLIVYVAASIACASAASMSAVIFWRFIQALGGSVVPTAVQAMVRDLYDRNQSARVLSLNMVVTASAPVMAPLIGGQLLLWFDWRGIFWVLVIFGVISLCAAFRLPETLAPSRRSEAHPVAMLLGYFQFLRSIRYVGYVACSAFYFCCLFAFIAGSPFVYIDYFGVPPQYYGFLFRRKHAWYDRDHLRQQSHRRAPRQRPSVAHRLRDRSAQRLRTLVYRVCSGRRHHWIGYPLIRGLIIADDGCFQCNFRGAFRLSPPRWSCCLPSGRHTVWFGRSGERCGRMVGQWNAPASHCDYLRLRNGSPARELISSPKCSQAS